MASDDQANTERWAELLEGTRGSLHTAQAVFSKLPAAPRCKLCLAPFGFPFGPVLRVFGVGQWEHNPRLCKACIKRIAKRPGGAEVELSLLFADVRGSTTLAETMAATDFTRQLNRFYRTTALAVDHANGIIDKVMGDGIMALFVPGISGPDHAAQAISAGRDLLDQSDSHQLPVGAGVHTGVAFVGVVGADEQTLDFTALGDTVNTAARLGSVAAPGELLVSDATMAKSGEDPAGLEHRELQLKGRTEPIGAWTVRSS